MTKSTMRFHLVDGIVTATFSRPLTGAQFAALYSLVRDSYTKRKWGERLIRAAREWDLKVELQPTSVELGIVEDNISASASQGSFTDVRTLPLRSPSSPVRKASSLKRSKVPPLGEWLLRSQAKTTIF